MSPTVGSPLSFLSLPTSFEFRAVSGDAASVLRVPRRIMRRPPCPFAPSFFFFFPDHYLGLSSFFRFRFSFFNSFFQFSLFLLLRFHFYHTTEMWSRCIRTFCEYHRFCARPVGQSTEWGKKNHRTGADTISTSAASKRADRLSPRPLEIEMKKKGGGASKRRPDSGFVGAVDANRISLALAVVGHCLFRLFPSTPFLSLLGTNRADVCDCLSFSLFSGRRRSLFLFLPPFGVFLRARSRLVCSPSVCWRLAFFFYVPGLLSFV